MPVTQGYTSFADVQRYTRRGEMLGKPNSPLSQTDVEAMIDAVGEELNGILRFRNVPMPLPFQQSDSPRAYAYLAYANAVCVAAMVTDRIFGDAGDGKASLSLDKRCQLLKDNLTQGKIELQDLIAGGNISPSDVASSGTAELDPHMMNSQPFFTRAGDNAPVDPLGT